MTKNFEKAKAAVDQCVKTWNKTTLTDIEKYHYEWWLILGMVKMALRFLSINDYQELKQYIWERYGFNVGGVYDRNKTVETMQA